MLLLWFDVCLLGNEQAKGENKMLSPDNPGCSLQSFSADRSTSLLMPGKTQRLLPASYLNGVVRSWTNRRVCVCVCDLCIFWKPGDGGCCSSNFRNVSQLPDFHLLYFRLFAGSLQYFTQFLIGADVPFQESKYSCFPYRNLPGKMRRFNVVTELNSAMGTHRTVTGLPELVERHWRKLP